MIEIFEWLVVLDHLNKWSNERIINRSVDETVYWVLLINYCKSEFQCEMKWMNKDKTREFIKHLWRTFWFGRPEGRPRWNLWGLLFVLRYEASITSVSRKLCIWSFIWRVLTNGNIAGYPCIGIIRNVWHVGSKFKRSDNWQKRRYGNVRRDIGSCNFCCCVRNVSVHKIRPFGRWHQSANIVDDARQLHECSVQYGTIRRADVAARG